MRAWVVCAIAGVALGSSASCTRYVRHTARLEAAVGDDGLPVAVTHVYPVTYQYTDHGDGSIPVSGVTQPLRVSLENRSGGVVFIDWGKSTLTTPSGESLRLANYAAFVDGVPPMPTEIAPGDSATEEVIPVAHVRQNRGHQVPLVSSGGGLAYDPFLPRTLPADDGPPATYKLTMAVVAADGRTTVVTTALRLTRIDTKTWR